MIYGYARFGYHPGLENGDDLKFREMRLREEGAQVVFIEFGVHPKPSKLDYLLEHMHKGDKLIVPSLGRISRDTSKCIAILEDLRDRGIEVRLLKECMTNTGEFFPVFASACCFVSSPIE